jgi:hypothetical protein
MWSSWGEKTRQANRRNAEAQQTQSQSCYSCKKDSLSSLLSAEGMFFHGNDVQKLDDVQSSPPRRCWREPFCASAPPRLCGNLTCDRSINATYPTSSLALRSNARI